MPRKSDVLSEEAASTSSPLRRSTRIQVNSPIPSAITTRRGSAQSISSDTSETTKPVKSRRGSVTQEKDEKPVAKPAPRGRKGSQTKEEEHEDTPRPVRTRRSSATEKTNTEELAKTPRGRRSSVTKEDPNPVEEEKPKRTLRARRGSTTSVDDPVEAVSEKKPTRGRRPSMDKEDEPEQKAVKVTPVKKGRRPSIAEATPLEPIEEQENEGRRDSLGKKEVEKVVSPERKAVGRRRRSTDPVEEETRGKLSNLSLRPRQKSVIEPSGLEAIEEHNSDGKSTETDAEVMKDCLTIDKIAEEEVVNLRRSPRINSSPKKCADLNGSVEKENLKKRLSMEKEKNLKVVLKEIEVSEKIPAKEVADKTLETVETVSVPNTNSQDASLKEDGVLNTSKTSENSDKENHSPKEGLTAPDAKVLGEKFIVQEVVVSRVSNVFRPKLTEYSFCEPMEVDESIIQNKTLNDAKKNLNVSQGEDTFDESFSLQLSVSRISQDSTDEKSTKGNSLQVDDDVFCEENDAKKPDQTSVKVIVTTESVGEDKNVTPVKLKSPMPKDFDEEMHAKIKWRKSKSPVHNSPDVLQRIKSPLFHDKGGKVQVNNPPIKSFRTAEDWNSPEKDSLRLKAKSPQGKSPRKQVEDLDSSFEYINSDIQNEEIKESAKDSKGKNKRRSVKKDSISEDVSQAELEQISSSPLTDEDNENTESNKVAEGFKEKEVSSPKRKLESELEAKSKRPRTDSEEKSNDSSEFLEGVLQLQQSPNKGNLIESDNEDMEVFVINDNVNFEPTGESDNDEFGEKLDKVEESDLKKLDTTASKISAENEIITEGETIKTEEESSEINEEPKKTIEDEEDQTENLEKSVEKKSTIIKRSVPLNETLEDALNKSPKKTANKNEKTPKKNLSKEDLNKDTEILEIDKNLKEANSPRKSLRLNNDLVYQTENKSVVENKKTPKKSDKTPKNIIPIEEREEDLAVEIQENKQILKDEKELVQIDKKSPKKSTTSQNNKTPEKTPNKEDANETSDDLVIEILKNNENLEQENELVKIAAKSPEKSLKSTSEIENNFVVIEKSPKRNKKTLKKNQDKEDSEENNKEEFVIEIQKIDNNLEKKEVVKTDAKSPEKSLISKNETNKTPKSNIRTPEKNQDKEDAEEEFTIEIQKNDQTLEEKKELGKRDSKTPEKSIALNNEFEELNDSIVNNKKTPKKNRESPKSIFLENKENTIEVEDLSMDIQVVNKNLEEDEIEKADKKSPEKSITLKNDHNDSVINNEKTPKKNQKTPKKKLNEEETEVADFVVDIKKTPTKKKETAEKVIEDIEKDDFVNVIQETDKKSDGNKSLKEDIIKSKSPKKTIPSEEINKSLDKLEENKHSEEADESFTIVKIPADKGNESEENDFENKFTDEKISEMEENQSYESSNDDEDDQVENGFISMMAEEGEEDTPSEGSNDIVDEGESINSTESEIDSDEDYENDSFVCDDDYLDELLSGEEYDLASDTEVKEKSKSRIINIDDRTEEVITIPRKEQKPVQKKKSRIITIDDSSDEDNIKLENKETTIENIEDRTEPFEVNAELVEITLQSQSSNKPRHSSFGGINSSSSLETRKKRTSSITIHENISVKEIQDSDLSERIQNLVSSFCSSVHKKGEISMNLSLEYDRRDSSPEEKKDIFEENTNTAKKSRKSFNKSKEVVVSTPVLAEKRRVSVEYEKERDSSPEEMGYISKKITSTAKKTRKSFNKSKEKSPLVAEKQNVSMEYERKDSSPEKKEVISKKLTRKAKKSRRSLNKSEETPELAEKLSDSLGYDKKDSLEEKEDVSKKMTKKAKKSRKSLNKSEEEARELAEKLSVSFEYGRKDSPEEKKDVSKKMTRKAKKSRQSFNKSEEEARELAEELSVSLEYDGKDSPEIKEDVSKKMTKKAKKSRKSLNKSEEAQELAENLSVSLEYKRRRDSSPEEKEVVSKKKARKAKKLRKSLNKPEEEAPELAEKLSVSLDETKIATEKSPIKKSRKKKRRSQSLESLEREVGKPKKKKQPSDMLLGNIKKSLERDLRLLKSKVNLGTKEKYNKAERLAQSADDLKTESWGIMNQLITDVKNRPVRTIKPTTSADMNNCWISEAAQVKPSTSAITKKERKQSQKEVRKLKIHPKDFRAQMLYDSSRVKRIETKSLLEKRGAFL